MRTGWRETRSWGLGLLLSVLVAGVSGCGSASESTTGGPLGGGEASAMPAPTTKTRTSDAVVEATPPGVAPVVGGTCPASGLLITAEEPDAAMGLRVMGLTMLNCGPNSRTVKGYPDVRMLDEDMSRLDVEIIHGAKPITTLDSFDAEPRSMTLRPGERALSGVVWRNTVTAVTGSDTPGAYLDVAPLAGSAEQRLRPAGGIDLGTTGRIGLAPWHAAG